MATKKLQFGFDFINGSMIELGDKPNGEKVVSYLCDFKGQRYFNIRAIYNSDLVGKWMPGKGLAVPASMMGNLIDGLGKQNTHNVKPIRVA